MSIETPGYHLKEKWLREAGGCASDSRQSRNRVALWGQVHQATPAWSTWSVTWGVAHPASPGCPVVWGGKDDRAVDPGQVLVHHTTLNPVAPAQVNGC